MLGEASLHLRASHERMLPSSGFVGTEEPGSFRRKSPFPRLDHHLWTGKGGNCGGCRDAPSADGPTWTKHSSELPSRTPSADLSLWLGGMKEDVVS